MNIKIVAEAALFPVKEYIKGFSLQCRPKMVIISASKSLFIITLIYNNKYINLQDTEQPTLTQILIV
jgi:hypothetical protein